jgi:hypothetical protein
MPLHSFLAYAEAVALSGLRSRGHYHESTVCVASSFFGQCVYHMRPTSLSLLAMATLKRPECDVLQKLTKQCIIIRVHMFRARERLAGNDA